MKIRAILILAFAISASILLAGCNNTPTADDGDITDLDTTAQPVPGVVLKKDKANVGKDGGIFDEKEAVSMEEPSEDQEVPLIPRAKWFYQRTAVIMKRHMIFPKGMLP